MKDQPFIKEYIVKIPLFEGPLDLLLHLVRKNKLDIFDLPIAIITQQYLEYIEMMKVLNIEVAGEYMFMAATLIYIKSQMLLPREESEEIIEIEDPRLQIAKSLLELAKYQEAAKWLLKRPLLDQDVFVPAPEEKTKDLLPKASMFELISALKKILERKPPTTYEVIRARIALSEKIAEIMVFLEERGRLYFSELLAKANTRQESIAYFLAILELAYREKVHLIQNSIWEDVEIIKR